MWYRTYLHVLLEMGREIVFLSNVQYHVATLPARIKYPDDTVKLDTHRNMKRWYTQMYWYELPSSVMGRNDCQLSSVGVPQLDEDSSFMSTLPCFTIAVALLSCSLERASASVP
jgi:hypothetical protein